MGLEPSSGRGGGEEVWGSRGLQGGCRQEIDNKMAANKSFDFNLQRKTWQPLQSLAVKKNQQ